PDFRNPQADCGPWRLRRVPDFLPVCLQDLLHRCKPEVRAQQVISEQGKPKLRGVPDGTPRCFVSNRKKTEILPSTKINGGISDDPSFYKKRPQFPAGCQQRCRALA